MRWKDYIVMTGVIFLVTVCFAVPTSINYQGTVMSGGVNFQGTGYFKFAIVDDPDLPTESYWSHDGTSVAGSEPSLPLNINVLDGLFHIELGQSPQEPLDPSVFENDPVYLRIWFSDGVNGFQMLSPDQPILSTGFSLNADTVDGLHATDLEESVEIDADIDTHAMIPDAHHEKTISFTELNDTATDDQIPDTISIDNGRLYAPTGSGNVGIGTTSPTYNLDVVSPSSFAFLRLQSESQYAGMIIDKAEPEDNGYIIYRQGGEDQWYAGLIDDNNYAISTNYINPDGKFYIDSETGYVGVGTTTPSRTLEVKGDWHTARLASSEPGAMLELVSETDSDWGITTWNDNLYLLSSLDDFATKTDEYTFSRSKFCSFENATKTLGSTSKKWSNIYTVDANVSGSATINQVTPTDDLVILGSDSLATVLINSNEEISEGSSQILLGEDDEGYYGMFLKYDGVGNVLEVLGKSGSTVYGPHITIERNTGRVGIGADSYNDARLFVEGTDSMPLAGYFDCNASAGVGTGIYVSADGAGGNTHYGVYAYATGAATNYAGYFAGNAHITGTLSKGGGSFKIDHPLDPENKNLYHSFVESPDMKNIYDGVVVLDQQGEAVVELPDWFDALNRDFRYQLTAIGAPGPNLYISQEIVGTQFAIAGGVPGMKVSWQVTGIREDAWANENRIPVEEDKPDHQKGKYLHPECFGVSEIRGIDYDKTSGHVKEQETAQPVEADGR